MPHKAHIDSDGLLYVGFYTHLGFTPGTVIEIIPTSAGSLILAINDEPVMIEATGQRLPAPQKQRALTGRGKG